MLCYQSTWFRQGEHENVKKIHSYWLKISCSLAYESSSSVASVETSFVSE